MSDKIWVGSTRVSAALTIARYVMVAAGGIFVSRGYLTDEQLNDVIGAILIVVPTLWGAYLAWRNNEQKKRMADPLPNSIAETKK